MEAVVEVEVVKEVVVVGVDVMVVMVVMVMVLVVVVVVGGLATSILSPLKVMSKAIFLLTSSSLTKPYSPFTLLSFLPISFPILLPFLTLLFFCFVFPHSRLS